MKPPTDEQYKYNHYARLLISNQKASIILASARALVLLVLIFAEVVFGRLGCR